MQTTWISRLLVLSFLAQGCSFAPTTSSKLVERIPASVMHSHHDPLGFQDFSYVPQKQRVYKYKGLLKAPPIRYLAKVISEAGLAIWIKTLPLEKAVEKRVLENLHSEKYGKDFLPFLLALKDIYTASKKYKKHDFHHHITKAIKDKDSIPGLEHSLFIYNEKKKAREEKKAAKKAEKQKKKDDKASGVEEEETTTSEMIAVAITIFDGIILRDPQFTLKSPPKRSGETVNEAAPHIKKLLDIVLDGMEKDTPTYEAVYAIASEPARVLAATASLIDAIHLYAYKHYQMFAARYAHKEKLKVWFDERLENREHEIVTYLQDSQENKKYGVHVMVDGLQGAMMEAFSLGDPSSPFLTQVYQEHQKRESFRPKQIAHKELPDFKVDFFDHFMKQKDGFHNPHYLPFFRSLYKEQINGIARTGISTTPTISIRNIPMIQAGAPAAGPGSTGLPNFHFVDRKDDRAYYFFGNDSILLDQLTSKAGMKTIAQRLPHLNTLNCMATYEAGSDWSIDPLLNLVLGEGARDFGELLCMEELDMRVKNEKKIRDLREKYLKLIRKGKDREGKKVRLLSKISELENETIPEYLSYYSPWPDHFAHFKGPFGDEIISPTGELNRLDYWLGRITEVYKKAGIYDRTLFVMAGDHGLSPVRYVLNPEVVIFGEMKKEGHDIKINKISSDEGEGPKLNDHVNPPTQHGYDVVIASTAGGNYMLDFFVDQGASFKRQPVYSELLNYQLLNGKTVNMIEESLNRLGETLDYLVVRETQCDPSGGAVRVMTKKSGKLSEAIVIREGEKIFYESETDLLQVKKTNPYSPVKYESRALGMRKDLVNKCMKLADKTDPSTWCNEAEWRTLTSFSPRPDSVGQLARLYDSDLAGTVNLFPENYIGYNSKVPGRHAGESFMEKDAFVGIWGAQVKKSERLDSEINGSVATTMYEYLSGERIKAHEKNFGFRGLMDELEQD